MRFAYPVEIATLTDADGGGVLVTFPDWDGAVTDGDDLADALAQAADCLEELVADRLNRRAALPRPAPVGDRPVVELGGRLAAKAALWQAMQDGDVSMNELARRLGQPSTLQVRRLLDPRTHSRPALIDEALAALGKRLVYSLEDRPSGRVAAVGSGHHAASSPR